MLKALVFLIALAFCYLDRYSTAIIIYWFPLDVIDNDFTIFIPHQSKNLKNDIGCILLILYIGFFIWHW